MLVTCAQCGNAFEAARSTAKYCGDTCRQQARRARRSGDAGETPPVEVGLVETVRAELTAASKHQTALGLQAIAVANRMVANRDTGSALAALSRELDRLLIRARAGGETEEDEVSAARRRRDEKRAAAQAGQAGG